MTVDMAMTAAGADEAVEAVADEDIGQEEVDTGKREEGGGDLFLPFFSSSFVVLFFVSVPLLA